jgi:hypothetical protein
MQWPSIQASTLSIEFDLLTNESAELLSGLHGFQAAVVTNCCPDVAMAKEPSHGFVVAWPVLEIDSRSRVSKLMNRSADSNCLLNAQSDLFAELQTVLRLTRFSREEARAVLPPEQRRPELMNIFVDEVAQGLIELEVEIDAVFYVVMGKDEPIR